MVAFINHPLPVNTKGYVMVLGPDGRPETWSGTYDDVIGLAWMPGDADVIVSGGLPRQQDALWLAHRGRAPRLLYQGTGALLVNDVSRDGRLLVTERDWREELALFHPGDRDAAQLEWFDWAVLSGLSDDGAGILFFENGVAVGGQGEILFRNPAQPAPTSIGLGRSRNLSPDGKWVAALRPESPTKLWLLPTGPGMASAVDVPGLDQILTAGFFRDGKRLALLAQAGGLTLRRLYVLNLEGPTLRPISPPLGADILVEVSPDEKWVAATGADGILTAYPVEGGEPERATELGPTHRLVGWLKDGSLLAVERYALPAPVRRLDRRSRAISHFATLTPADRTGVVTINSVRVTPDGRTFAFTYVRMSSALFVLDWGSSLP
jgi:hypothetical protein